MPTFLKRFGKWLREAWKNRAPDPCPVALLAQGLTDDEIAESKAYIESLLWVAGKIRARIDQRGLPAAPPPKAGRKRPRKAKRSVPRTSAASRGSRPIRSNRKKRGK